MTTIMFVTFLGVGELYVLPLGRMLRNERVKHAHSFRIKLLYRISVLLEQSSSSHCLPRFDITRYQIRRCFYVQISAIVAQQSP